jgi:hypothetical protein
VVPNPSGRNAHFTYEQMLRQFVSLREIGDRLIFSQCNLPTRDL